MAKRAKKTPAKTSAKPKLRQAAKSAAKLAVATAELELPTTGGDLDLESSPLPLPKIISFVAAS